MKMSVGGQNIMELRTTRVFSQLFVIKFNLCEERCMKIISSYLLTNYVKTTRLLRLFVGNINEVTLTRQFTLDLLLGKSSFDFLLLSLRIIRAAANAISAGRTSPSRVQHHNGFRRGQHLSDAKHEPTSRSYLLCQTECL